MKTQILLAATLLCVGATVANAQIVGDPGPPVYWGPPAATYFAPPTVTYYAPQAQISVRRPVGAVVAPVAPAPVAAYYAPAPVTTYYAPASLAAPVTTYYAPARVAAPVTTYYAPAPVAVMRPVYVRRGLFGRLYAY
jgi:hypothetical protein